MSDIEPSWNDDPIGYALEYDDEHPEVWDYFFQQALTAHSTGREHFGAAYIIETMRWDTDIPAPNDRMAAYYARKFMIEQNLPGFFRVTKSFFDEWEPWWLFNLRAR